VKRVALFTLIFSVAAFAGGGGGETDILPRTVNFIIFAAIVYYLLADKVREFFKNRSASIAAKLESVQAHLKEAREEKARAEKELENAKKLAAEIIETAKEESKLLSEKIKNDLQEELKVMEKIFAENCELEERKMVREVIKNILDETFEDKNIVINEKEFVNLIVKKVA